MESLAKTIQCNTTVYESKLIEHLRQTKSDVHLKPMNPNVMIQICSTTVILTLLFLYPIKLSFLSNVIKITR